MNSKLNTIKIPCYNKEQYLDKYFKFKIEQTFTNWGCISVKDALLNIYHITLIY